MREGGVGRVDRSPTRRKGRRLAVAAGLVAAASVLAGCNSSGQASAPTTTAAEAPVSGGKLVVAVPMREPQTALRLFLEPLTAFAADGTVVPYLAESVEPNATFDRWKIRVRKDITFQNGERLDAKAVKANLDTFSVSPVFHTDPFAPIKATTVVDDRTVEVELAEPWASFPAHLTAEQADGTGLMAAPATLEEMGTLFLANPTATGVFGTGPFVLDASASGSDRWVARRNPTYWRQGLPYLDEVEIRVIADDASRTAGLDADDIDIALTSRPPSDAGSRKVVTQNSDPQVLAVALNTQRPPLADPSLREALAAATDVEALARSAGVDPGQIANGPFGPGSPWTDASKARVKFDPDRARSLVSDYERANGPLRVRLGAADLETGNIAVQQELAQQWKDVGIDVELNVVDPFQQTATLLVAQDFDAVIGNMFGKPDPDMDYFWWHSSALKAEGKGAGYNFVGLDDPALDTALDEARGTLDTDARRRALATVQERLADHAAYVWLWGTRWSAVANARVHGLDTTPLPGGGTRLAIIGPRLALEGVWLQR